VRGAALALILLIPASAAGDVLPQRARAGTVAVEDARIWSAEVDAALPSATAEAPPPDTATDADLRQARAEGAGQEADFDLPSALRAYLRACTGARPNGDAPAAWSTWEAACDDAVRVAWGLEDDAALRQALSALLGARPERDLPAGRFAEGTRVRARDLAAGQQIGALRVQGRGQPVWVDGRPRGLAPLVMPGLPLGQHRVTCGERQADVMVQPGVPIMVDCAIPDQVEGAHTIGMRLHSGQAAVVLAADDAVRMDPGTWVFWSDMQVTGLHVGQPSGCGDGVHQVQALRVR